jgi:hypothetical protein
MNADLEKTAKDAESAKGWRAGDLRRASIVATRQGGILSGARFRALKGPATGSCRYAAEKVRHPSGRTYVRRGGGSGDECQAASNNLVRRLSRIVGLGSGP